MRTLPNPPVPSEVEGPSAAEACSKPNRGGRAAPPTPFALSLSKGLPSRIDHQARIHAANCHCPRCLGWRAPDRAIREHRAARGMLLGLILCAPFWIAMAIHFLWPR